MTAESSRSAHFDFGQNLAPEFGTPKKPLEPPSSPQPDFDDGGVEKNTQEKIRKCCATSKRVSWLAGAMVPARVKGAEFVKNFFLPTVVNYASKVKNVVAKIFAVLGALLFDVLTFPLRVITVVPRVFY